MARIILCPKKQSSGKSLLFAVSVLNLCFLLTGAQSVTTTTILVDPSKPIEGGNVSLIPASVPANTVSCGWFRGGDAPENTILLHYFLFFIPRNQRPGANYTGRETLGSKCSLHITNLAGNYSGNYSFLLGSADKTIKGKVELHISEPVSGVSISSTPSEILEGDVTTLICSAAKGSEVSFFWFKGDQILESDDRISLINDSRVLTFNTTLQRDSGVYTCLVNNSFSSNNDSHTLNVFYLPSEGLGLGPGAVTGIVMASLALGLGLTGGLLYFIPRICRQRKKPTSDPIQSGPTTYENLSCPGQKTIGENPRSSSDLSSHTYESLQKRTPNVYEEIKHLK